MYLFQKVVTELRVIWLGLEKKDSGGRNGKEITLFPPPKRMSTPTEENQGKRISLKIDCVIVGPTHPTALCLFPLDPGIAPQAPS